VNNAGEEGSVVVGKLLELQAAGDANIGYNAATSEYVDLIKAGVIDPVKVREPNCCTCCTCCTCCSRSRSFGSKHARLGVTRTYTCICIVETCWSTFVSLTLRTFDHDMIWFYSRYISFGIACYVWHLGWAVIVTRILIKMLILGTEIYRWCYGIFLNNAFWSFMS
jgi:hypothetical protein